MVVESENHLLIYACIANTSIRIDGPTVPGRLQIFCEFSEGPIFEAHH